MSPVGTKVHRCVMKNVRKGMGKGKAIAVCQKSTGKSYATGKKPKSKARA